MAQEQQIADPCTIALQIQEPRMTIVQSEKKNTRLGGSKTNMIVSPHFLGKTQRKKHIIEADLQHQYNMSITFRGKICYIMRIENLDLDYHLKIK